MSEPSRIILASGSPRRRELMGAIGLTFTVQPADMDEDALQSSLKGYAPRDLAVALAGAKARFIAAQTPHDALVIGADTIVVLEDRIYNKPVDDEDAVRMLTELSGNTHQVITGICVVRVVGGEPKETLTDWSTTHVTFAVFDETVARAYVATGEPLDKAGAYGIQGKGTLLIAGLDGDYFNVVGLPVYKLGQLLESLGVELW